MLEAEQISKLGQLRPAASGRARLARRQVSRNLDEDWVGPIQAVVNAGCIDVHTCRRSRISQSGSLKNALTFQLIIPNAGSAGH